MKLSELKSKDVNLASTRKRRTTSGINIINNYKNKSNENTSQKHLESVSSASQTHLKSVSNASQECLGKIKKNAPKGKIVSNASQDRLVVREQVCLESVLNTSQERLGIYDFADLSSRENSFLKYLFEVCSSIGQRETFKTSNSETVKLMKTSSAGLRNLILRLKKKEFLTIISSKNGPSGWRIYGLPESVYKKLSEQENIMRVSQMRLETVSNASRSASHESSSSNNNISNTITTDKSLENIQTPQNLKSLGFGIGHIKQLKEKFNLSTGQIQKNLESFAYDLANGELERLKNRGIQNIIGYFFGAMKSGGYNSVINGFIPAEELAEQEMLERLEKIKTEKKERKIKLEELLFEEWIETKTKDDLMVIQSPMVNYMDSFHKAALKGYFVDNELEKFKQDFQ